MMRLTVVGFLAGLVLCEAVQGFDDAALRMVLETIQGSTKFVSEAAGRSLQGLRVSQRVGHVRVCLVMCLCGCMCEYSRVKRMQLSCV